MFPIQLLLLVDKREQEQIVRFRSVVHLQFNLLFHVLVLYSDIVVLLLESLLTFHQTELLHILSWQSDAMALLIQNRL